ncbi:MAG: acetyltransferase [Myxococcales bacterium]|nr:acetyltransferase [Myxococcales bacterium]
MLIRHCRRDDLDALEWDGAFTHDRDIIRDTFAHAATGTMIMLVAEEDGSIVGQLWIDLARYPKVAYVWAVRVRPVHRTHGLATHLLAEAERIGASHACAYAELDVDADNVRAVELYARLGYREVRRDGFIRMRKSL